MKKLPAAVIGLFILVILTLVCGILGMGAGSLIGERIVGNKEPVIEMLIGGWIGAAIGLGVGAGFFASIKR